MKLKILVFFLNLSMAALLLDSILYLIDPGCYVVTKGQSPQGCIDLLNYSNTFVVKLHVHLCTPFWHTFSDLSDFLLLIRLKGWGEGLVGVF